MSQPRPAARAALLFAAATALTLSACSRQGEDQQSEAATGEPAPPPPGATPAVTAPTTATAPMDGTIPQALRGRWGLVAADCTSTHGDAKGLLEVGATTLTFYESRATLKSIRTAQLTRLRADYAFSGEGQEWTQDIELRTWNSGAQLIRQDRGPDALPGPLTYTRCGG